MTDDRKRAIADRAWQVAANRVREAMREQLEQTLRSYTFLDRDVSLEFGSRFWNRVQQLPYDLRKLMNESVAELGKRETDLEVVWLHRRTNEAGAIRTHLKDLLDHAETLRRAFGPDFLFADQELSLGVCFEADEHETYLRWWR